MINGASQMPGNHSPVLQSSPRSLISLHVFTEGGGAAHYDSRWLIEKNWTNKENNVNMICYGAQTNPGNMNTG